MTQRTRKILFTTLILAASGGFAMGQGADRLSKGIESQAKIRLRGSRDARVEKLASHGPVEDSVRVKGISFRFRPSAAQAAALERLLKEQQNPWSPLYHAWLTPEEFGERFGLSAGDFARVRGWLESEGFRVDATARSRNWITFSGTAVQVRNTFLADIHRFVVDGKERYANVDEAALPAELEPIVLRVDGLDNFLTERGMQQTRGVELLDGRHAIGPDDLAVIYNLKPLFDMGINGEGQNIVVTGQSAFRTEDVREFRSDFALPKIDPRVVLAPGFTDPGITHDETEALMDLQYVGAGAPRANIIYVYSLRVQNALQYAVDQNLAPVISQSFGVCEANVARVQSAAELFRGVAQQANAQGITFVSSSGDTGPFACDVQQVDSEGVEVSVNVPASVPEVTAVGGTRFDESTGGKYWSTGTVTAGKGSALSYIPETAWNDTAVDGTLAVGGGGVSLLYPRPAWQTGAGVPSGNMRLVPDVSFTASWYHDPYILMKGGKLIAAGGTSIAAPFFAGVVALLNQHVMKNGGQAKPGLGNINPRLYQLAQTSPSVFHDITTGNNITPCKTSTPQCTNGRFGHQAGPGYDLATGLGSIDVKNLVDQWIDSAPKPGAISTTLQLTATPQTLAADSSAVLTATVKAMSGTVSPMGNVTFHVGLDRIGSASLSGSGGSATATFSVRGSQLPAGATTVTAVYEGSGGFGPARGSATIVVPSQPKGSVVVPSVEPNPVVQQERDTDGYEWYYTVHVKETAGVATKLTAFSVGEHDLTQYINDWFGSANLPANGTLSAKLRSRDLPVPTEIVFSFSGVDAGGRVWSKQIPVRFVSAAETKTAVMSLTSTPDLVLKVGKGDPNCPADRPYFQQLNLRELNGHEVELSKFVAGGFDYTSQIASWFGSLRLPASGTLTARLCWKLDTVPVTLHYQMDGTDKSGNAIQSKLSVDFRSLDTKSGDELEIRNK